MDAAAPAEPFHATFELTAVAVVLDEGLYLEEWIAYHTVVGVEHFFIYDNGSTDGTAAVLEPYVNHGLVTLMSWPHRPAQTAAYHHAVQFFGHTSRWMATIDLDEFVVPLVDDDLTALLRRLDADQVVIPWRRFGTGGHVARPQGMVIESYLLAENLGADGPRPTPVKSIFKPSALVRVANHAHVTRSGHGVDAFGEPAVVSGGRLTPTRYGAAQVNHYQTKSLEEVRTKLEKRRPTSAMHLRRRLEDIDADFQTPDRAISRFVAPTRERFTAHRALAPEPFRFGSQLPPTIARFNPFVRHVSRAVSNHLRRVPVPANGYRALNNLLGGRSTRGLVTEGPLPGASPPGRLIDSVHGEDLVRRLGATVVWRLGPSPSASIGGQDCAVTSAPLESLVVTPSGPMPELCLPTGHVHAMRHYAIVMALRTAERARVWWAVDGAEPESGLAVELPIGADYWCAVEVNPTLVDAATARVGLQSEAPIAIGELTMLCYG